MVDRSHVAPPTAPDQTPAAEQPPSPALSPDPGLATATVPPAAPEPYGVVVFGDSVAHTLAGGVVGAYPRFEPWTPEQSPFDPSHVRLWSVAKPACSFLPGRATIEGGDPVDLGGFCGDWRADLDEALAAHPARFVLVALSNDATDRLVGTDLVPLGSPGHAALVGTLLDEIRLIATERGADLGLVILPPRVGSFALGIDRSGLRERAMRDAQTTYAAAHRGVRLLDLSAQVCPDRDCGHPSKGFDPSWRYDGLHFSAEGARWTAAWITAVLDQR